MNKALTSSVAVAMTLGVLLGGCSSVSPAQAISAPAITIEDQYDIPGRWTSVLTFCRNGDYLVYLDTSSADTLQMVPELNERCKD